MELRVFSPTAILGYGFPAENIDRVRRLGVDYIGVDGGSTDPGPYYLGSGENFVPWESVERDLRLLLRLALDEGAPLLVGTAGGAGARPHVDTFLRVLRRAAEKLGARVRVALFYSDIEKEYLLERLGAGEEIPSLDGVLPPLTDSVVAESERIVAQAGVEPFVDALRLGADVVVGGRAVDVAPFAAPAWLHGLDKGLAIHMGKILECGAIAAEPGSGSDSMYAIIREGEFEVFPVNPSRRATTTSVAEHALYERTDPFREYIPGGYADMTNAVYEEAGRSVVVRGARWVPLPDYRVKLEGVRFVGHRYVFVAGIRDPGALSRLDLLLGEAIRHVRELVGEDFRVYTRVYGRDGVMGASEPHHSRVCHEAGIVVEVVARKEETARQAAGLLRSTLMHLGWPGRKTTAGNLALPFSPSEFYGGAAYEWSVWHILRLSDYRELFSVHELTVG